MASRPPYTIPYNPKFLGEEFNVPLPITCCDGKLVQGGQVFDYIHYSLVMHQDRRTALYTAHNIDYAQKNSARGGRWDVDDRMDTTFQTDNHAYRNNDWDRGHLVRRDAVVWGNRQEAQDASDSTYFYTNAALQHKNFNQSSSRWLGLEDWILHKAGSFANRLCVFTGPIYTEIDEKTNRGYTIPSAFWKVVVLRDPSAEGDDLSAIAFLMKQNENWRAAGRRALANLQPYHVSIAEIEAYTGLSFGQIAEVDEFDWRQVRYRNRSLMPAIPVNGPDDIVFSGARRRAQGVRANRTYRSGSVLPSAKVSRNLFQKQQDCGCKSSSAEIDIEIKALKKQTTALCEIVETLIENNQGNFNKTVIRSLEKLSARIIGGQIVGLGEFPECVAIGDEFEYFCSGILVHPKVVLTAAHCATDSITRVLLNARQVTENAEEMEVEEVFVHPSYTQNQIPWHDIAVLILKEASGIQPVEIASKTEVIADDSLILVGFGSDDPDGLAGFGTKRRVDVPLTKNPDAATALINQQRHGYDADFEFHGGRVRSGQDTCNGDSGGPAYIKINNQIKVAGLTSRAANSSTANCGDGGNYTLIDAYSTWIYEVTGGLVGRPIGETENGEETHPVNLYISAALPNPSGPEAGNEWVEITNNSVETIALDNYFLEDRQNGRQSVPQGELAAGDTKRIVLPSDSAVKLGNSGDDIRLLQGDEVIHEVKYSRAKSEQVLLFDPPPKPEDHQNGEEKEEQEDKNKEQEDCKCSENPNCDKTIDPAFTPGALRC